MVNEVQDVGPGDDEHQISIVIQKKFKQHSLVVGRALFAYFGYKPQRFNDLQDVQFIPEYRRLSQE
ncbi:unnamed protein product, partial [Rotaria magnacalcarata]